MRDTMTDDDPDDSRAHRGAVSAPAGAPGPADPAPSSPGAPALADDLGDPGHGDENGHREPGEPGAAGDRDEPDDTEKPAAARSPVRLAIITGMLLVVVLGTLSGWLEWRAYQSHQADQQRALFVEVARQGALNLTTIDWQHADADVQRVLDSATGPFHDDFQQRSAPFIEVVKQAQSKSVGSISEAGVESASNTEAQVLVAASVKTSVASAPDQQPRAWRMRIVVQKTGDQAKVSNVEFVP